MGKKKGEKKDDTVNAKLSLVVKSGKYRLGYRSTLDALRRGKAKLLVISKNCPPLRRSELEYYAMLSKSSVIPFSGTNVDLGVACGKVYRASVMAVLDQGDSDIFDFGK